MSLCWRCGRWRFALPLLSRRHVFTRFAVTDLILSTATSCLVVQTEPIDRSSGSFRRSTKSSVDGQRSMPFFFHSILSLRQCYQECSARYRVGTWVMRPICTDTVAVHVCRSITLKGQHTRDGALDAHLGQRSAVSSLCSFFMTVVRSMGLHV